VHAHPTSLIAPVQNASLSHDALIEPGDEFLYPDRFPILSSFARLANAIPFFLERKNNSA